jgi:hypothetical protein
MRTPSRPRQRIERDQASQKQARPQAIIAAMLLRAAAKIDKAVTNELRTSIRK